jgi:hypothetical protein
MACKNDGMVNIARHCDALLLIADSSIAYGMQSAPALTGNLIRAIWRAIALTSPVIRVPAHQSRGI